MPNSLFNCFKGPQSETVRFVSGFDGRQVERERLEALISLSLSGLSPKTWSRRTVKNIQSGNFSVSYVFFVFSRENASKLCNRSVEMD